MTGIDASSGRALGGIAHLRQSVSDILTTPIGSRVLLREYGSRLHDLLDRPLEPALLASIQAEAAGALTRWEPRLRLSRVRAESVSGERVTFSLEGVRLPGGQPIRLEGVQASGPALAVAPPAPAAPEPEPESVWTAALGDASHVYARALGVAPKRLNQVAFQLIADGAMELPAKLTTSNDPETFFIRARDAGPVAVNVGGAPAVNFISVEIHAGIRFLFRYRSATADALAALALPPADRTDPFWIADPGAAFKALAAAVIADLAAGAVGRLDAALAWAGAGSAVDLDAQTTDLSGTDPTQGGGA